MADTISVDISYFQNVVDDSYPRRWLIFRGCDGDFTDPHAAWNAAWAKRRQAARLLDGWSVYAAYRPGQVPASLAILDRLGLAGGHVMVDVESWGGQITGDHSPEINSFQQQLAARVGWGRVWEYGNADDLAAIHPHRDPRVRVHDASYGGTRPNVPGLVGWQYTDGTWDVPGLPSSTPPFGPCDHNVLYDPGTAVVPPPSITLGGQDMFELIRDQQGGVYQVSTLIFRHITTLEDWRVVEGSPLNVHRYATRQVNNRERDLTHLGVSANIASLRG